MNLSGLRVVQILTKKFLSGLVSKSWKYKPGIRKSGIKMFNVKVESLKIETLPYCKGNSIKS